jgi:SAM-dependent methyltransferase
VTPEHPWLASVWPFVSDHLPVPPAAVLEIGCGPVGGFVPALLAGGYDAVGVDPEAPDGPAYRGIPFEEYEPQVPVDCVVACTSLHHVADLDRVLDQIATTLEPGGGLVVVEWAWELFDEATARWCFSRLASPAQAQEPGWLHRHRDNWATSGRPWDAYVRDWAAEEGMHPGEQIMRGLDARFERSLCSYGPHFFADLDDATEADEQAAIGAEQIWATGIRYVGRRP